MARETIDLKEIINRTKSGCHKQPSTDFINWFRGVFILYQQHQPHLSQEVITFNIWAAIRSSEALEEARWEKTYGLSQIITFNEALHWACNMYPKD